MRRLIFHRRVALRFVGVPTSRALSPHPRRTSEPPHSHLRPTRGTVLDHPSVTRRWLLLLPQHPDRVRIRTRPFSTTDRQAISTNQFEGHPTPCHRPARCWDGVSASRRCATSFRRLYRSPVGPRPVSDVPAATDRAAGSRRRQAPELSCINLPHATPPVPHSGPRFHCTALPSPPPASNAAANPSAIAHQQAPIHPPYKKSTHLMLPRSRQNCEPNRTSC